MTPYFKKHQKSKKASEQKQCFHTFSKQVFDKYEKAINKVQGFWRFENKLSLIIKQLQRCFLYMGYFADGGIVLSKNKIILLKISKSISSV